MARRHRPPATGQIYARQSHLGAGCVICSWFPRVYSTKTDRSTGLICDQTIALDGHYTRKGYHDRLRRVRFKDPESGKTFVFVTNQMTLPAASICAL